MFLVQLFSRISFCYTAVINDTQILYNTPIRTEITTHLNQQDIVTLQIRNILFENESDLYLTLLNLLKLITVVIII